MGKDQEKFRLQVQPFLDVLQQGPTNFDDAMDMNLVDSFGYHQDLLASFAHDGTKIWSLRKYCDAGIVQAVFGDIDTEALVIPQVFGKKKKDKNEMEPVTQLNLSMMSMHGSSKLDDYSIKVEVVVPRTVGLIYLDRAIEGYVNTVDFY